MAHENNVAAIRQLQRYLRALSYFDGIGGRVPLDGIFDDATEAALRAFQEKSGLPVSGRADQESFERLLAAYNAQNRETAAPARISHFPRFPTGYTVEAGETQFLVEIIQHALQELATVYDWERAIERTGVYDEQTAAAVRQFQQIHSLPQTGGVDLATWTALANAYNRGFAGYFEQ
ncbi:MAG: peptidoglycan-binding protein [Clostridia bacterium]|nr:peptidoglycan-binding protein [Clostridia bacterium]